MALLLNSSASPCMNPSSGPIPDGQPLETTIGALLIGTFLGLVLFGIAAHQAWRYFIFGTDTKLLRGWVSSIMIMETLHSVFCMHMCYHFLMESHSHTGILTGRVWSGNMLGIFTGLIILLCQSFLSRYVLHFWTRHGWSIVFPALVLSLGQFALVTAATVLLYLWPADLDTFAIRLLNCTHSALAVAANVILAVAFSYRLLSQRTGFQKTGSVIRLLILYTIHGGILIFMMALVSLIVTFVLPKSQIFTAIDIAATKIYTNMLLAIINARSNNDADTQATNHGVENFTDDTGGSLGWLCKRTTVIASYAATSSGSPSYLPEVS
ncbi:hypothetical protein BD311DRAFT_762620 [Dichomitus squalens]|uniref:DUF6534 domain-containing protein n=1 Tax=Dichomitus squalens TaxID=114155 RepID=A0A4Q9MG73_9APHY|nr:hypothetical protein BD311DRAFT_762620 [Dichomitus squalens]